MILRALVALLLLVLAGCAAQPPAQEAAVCPLVRLAQVPIESRGNLLFTRAVIAGHSVSLLIDTGAERTLLTEATVDRLRLPRDPDHATRTFGIGEPTEAWDAQLPGGMTLGTTNFPVPAVTVGKFSINDIEGISADGLLGADLLLPFDLDIDLPARRMTMYRPRRQCPDGTPPWAGPYYRLAGISVRQDRLMVPFVLDGTTGLGVLDTGAQLSSVSLRVAERVGVDTADLEADRVVMAHGAAPDHVPVRIHRFREFRIGPAVMRDPVLPVVDLSEGMGDALVGADFLEGRRAWISYSTRRVFVTPLAPASEVAER